jgi:hypothetical protein
LTVLERSAPNPLPTDPNDPLYGGVSMEVAGSLHVDRSVQVDGLVNAVSQVLIGSLFDSKDKTPLSPLTITASGNEEELIQFRAIGGRETWHISENVGGTNPGINFGEIVSGKPAEGRLFVQATLTSAGVPSPRNVGIGSLTPRSALGIRGQGPWEEVLSFEDSSGNTKWHVNHNPKGATPSGVPFTRGLNFCETGVGDFRLFLQSGGNVGVGTPAPQQNLSVNGGLNIDQANLNGGVINPGLTFGSTSGEGIASRRSGGGNQFGLDFYTEFAVRMSITQAGRVGLGVTLPDSQLQLSGGVWDLTNAEGDFKIGNPAMRLKIGVALGGAGAGDARIRAQGGTSRLMLGSDANDTVTIQGTNVGINTITPTAALDVVGATHFAGPLTVSGAVNVVSAVNITGPVKISGPLTVTGAKSGYVADRFIYLGTDTLERGDVVALHPHPSGKALSHGRIPLVEVRLSDSADDTCVCGIVDEPALDADQIGDLDSRQIAGSVGLMVTLGAYAFCKVDATEAAIKPGDLLVTSATKGHACRAPRTDVKPGAIIAKALAAVAHGKTGVIPVLVSHQ